METEIRSMTHDQKFEIIVKYRPGQFSFILMPAYTVPKSSNTKFYAFAGDLIFQLEFWAMRMLKSLSTMPQNNFHPNIYVSKLSDSLND